MTIKIQLLFTGIVPPEIISSDCHLKCSNFWVITYAERIANLELSITEDQFGPGLKIPVPIDRSGPQSRHKILNLSA